LRSSIIIESSGNDHNIYTWMIVELDDDQGT